MWLRRAFFWWLFPAAVVLPLWLLAGWIIFNANGWALLWVLLLAMPSVFFGQIVLSLLVRARGTVRAQRAVSWPDVAGFTVWHALIVATGFFSAQWFAPVLVLAIAAALGLFWLSLWQLWAQARSGARTYLRTADATGFIPSMRPTSSDARADVIVVSERRSDA
ncbi:MFS transporter permease [Microbacterium sp. RD1]|uniref:MFS transporter permease n=1 Tax=Microbacterium sp. RD1 TaxID=3457313 RepID=UPI003FA57F34